MKQLIDDLLSYSRVTNKSEELEKVNLETILESVLSTLSISIVEYNATVTHESLPTVLADSSQIGQVFQNLKINAIKIPWNPYIC